MNRIGMTSRTLPWALGLGVALGAAGCDSSSGAAMQQLPTQSQPVAASGAADPNNQVPNNQVPNDQVPNDQVPPTNTPMDAPMDPMNTPMDPMDPMDTPMDTPMDPPMEPEVMFEQDCEGGSVGPCGSFMLETSGMSLELGPYGAIMEANMGADFKAAVSPSDTEAGCAGFAALFAEDPDATERLLDIQDLDLSLYTVYRPGKAAEGEKFPLIVWGNGTCAQPEGYGALLRYVASHGYVIVAPNSRYVGFQSPMTKALDFMFAANEDASSPYYQLMDTTKVGAMGHSQGSAATASAAADRRIGHVILWNGGTSASKPFLAISGQYDIGSPTTTSMRSGMTGSASNPAAFIFYLKVPMTGTLSGHLTLMTQPERVVAPAVAWWDMVLKGDDAGKAFFVGDDCGLCKLQDQMELNFGVKGIQ